MAIGLSISDIHIYIIAISTLIGNYKLVVDVVFWFIDYGLRTHTDSTSFNVKSDKKFLTVI